MYQQEDQTVQINKFKKGIGVISKFTSYSTYHKYCKWKKVNSVIYSLILVLCLLLLIVIPFSVELTGLVNVIMTMLMMIAIVRELVVTSKGRRLFSNSKMLNSKMGLTKVWLFDGGFRKDFGVNHFSLEVVYYPKKDTYFLVGLKGINWIKRFLKIKNNIKSIDKNREEQLRDLLEIIRHNNLVGDFDYTLYGTFSEENIIDMHEVGIKTTEITNTKVTKMKTQPTKLEWQYIEKEERALYPKEWKMYLLEIDDSVSGK